MPDDRKKPPPPIIGATPAVRIPLRVTERQSGRHVDHHEHESPASPPPREEFEDEEYTDQHPLQELPALRAKRPTPVRLAHIEKNVDELRAENRSLRRDMKGVQVAVADMGGQFKVIPQLVETMQSAIDAFHEREQVELVSKVKVSEAKQLEVIEEKKDERHTERIKLETKREWGSKILAIASAAIALVSTGIAVGRC